MSVMGAWAPEDDISCSESSLWAAALEDWAPSSERKTQGTRGVQKGIGGDQLGLHQFQELLAMPGSVLQGDTEPRLAGWWGQDRCVDQMVPNCSPGVGEARVQGRMWRRPQAGEGRIRRRPAPSP